MIDSSGRRGLRANGTVLDLLPVSQVIAVAGILLVVLFTFVKPEASNGLGFWARTLFWALHVGLGLGALWIAGRWLASGNRLPNGTLIPILVTGCAGVLLATPAYLALDALYQPYLVDIDPDPAVDSLVIRIIGEALELAPWFLASWILINLPVLLPPTPLSIRLDDTADHDSDSGGIFQVEDKSEPDAEVKPAPKLHLVSNNQADDDSNLEPAKEQQHQTFLLNLPGIVGTDIIAVASDLHYLNVWTVAGRTTVLGNLRDVAEELAAVGTQVHRSHWVAHAHVRRIVGNANNAACIMSNELRVPISRRRWKDVREQYGRGVVHSANANDEKRLYDS